MPKLQGLLTEKNDVKVFILFLMANVGYPLKYDEVHDITVQNDYVGYCDFAECFAEHIRDALCKQFVRFVSDTVCSKVIHTPYYMVYSKKKPDDFCQEFSIFGLLF